ncbi:hypothetical protein HMPREF1860_01771 [Prevotella amnii]|uniref:Uncharacterized protein n=1 Tax=Prevotella amnii TaxID=419005 RepID=A0A134B714_9BACT|nr:hypothetical protein HMPREF1860_01771 [Prevotella amnii]
MFSLITLFVAILIFTPLDTIFLFICFYFLTLIMFSSINIIL